MAEEDFNGEKICHAFETNKTTYTKTIVSRRKGTSIEKKISSTSSCYGSEFISDAVALQIANATLHTKVDGQCGLILYNESKGTYHPYCRHDIKYDEKANDWDPRYLTKNDDGSYTPIDITYIPCQPNPGASPGYHWPFWRPVDQKRDKWLHAAFVIMMNDYDLSLLPKKSFTCEYMGNKSNRCESDLLPDYVYCAIIPHHMLPTIDIPSNQRTYDNFLHYFQHTNPYVEGIVAYCDNGIKYKIRRDMFKNNDGAPLSWPNGPAPFENTASIIFHRLIKKQKLSKSE